MTDPIQLPIAADAADATAADATVADATAADTRPAPHPRARAALVALNAADGLPRGAACELGGRLDLLLPAFAAGCRASPALARSLGVPRSALERARYVLGRAEERARREEDAVAALGGRIVTRVDPDYPPALFDLELPPPALYVRGRLGTETGAPETKAEEGKTEERKTEAPAPRPAVALVGARRTDAYGREVAIHLARELARAGVTVVSGFARGIDAASHQAAMDGAQGSATGAEPPTLALLGAGLGVDYPKGHRPLGEAVAEAGALISEFPCGTQPRPWRFPVRNRLIAALSTLTVVIRATERSGSLVTARAALDLGRDVAAVPGSIFSPLSTGPNGLIRDGAHPVLSPDDLLLLLGWTPPKPSPSRDPSPVAGGLAGRIHHALIPAEPTAPEELSTLLDEPVDKILGTLLELELTGQVHREPGGRYIRKV